MGKLLIGSVFKNDDVDQCAWLDNQLSFLKNTTNNYDHFCVISEGKKSDFFTDNTKVIESLDKQAAGSQAHLNGLNVILEEFNKRQDDYDEFLILDSDAFPIRKNWKELLLKQMTPQDSFDQSGFSIPLKSKNRNYDIAICLRTENLENRLHASILFIKKQALMNISFKYGSIGCDLVGKDEVDIFLPKYQNELSRFSFPLIRTNKINVHPISCGIYYDMFYHHACGSRDYSTRGSSFYYENLIKDREKDFSSVLMENPIKFTSMLAGWNPKLYCS